jgi:hypothetical protein
MHATYPAHLTHLDFIIRVIFGEEYHKLGCSLLFSFLQPPIFHPCSVQIFPAAQHSKYLKSMFFPLTSKKSITLIQNYGQNYSFVYFNFYVFDSRRTDEEQALPLKRSCNFTWQCNAFTYLFSKILNKIKKEMPVANSFLVFQKTDSYISLIAFKTSIRHTSTVTFSINWPTHQITTLPCTHKYTRESKKLSALLFFQFIYTKVGVEQVRHFST